MPDMKTRGQVAYEAYCKYTEGKSLVTGVLLPLWDVQKEGIRQAWEAAALAVSAYDMPPPPPGRPKPPPKPPNQQ
jgi:hypothetical protein